MARYTFTVLSNAVAGRESEYNDWYTQQHLPDVLKAPGFVSARRMRLLGDGGQWQYLALYEMETENPDATLVELRNRAGGPLMPMSDALDRQSMFTGLFELIAELP
jgi:hypothetical protein